MANATKTLESDILIFGAGIAGLWALNRLAQSGLTTLLLETKAIGAGQSIHSQGIIHGGLKYALNGKHSPASKAIADMPRRWQACFQGKGELDLRQAQCLSQGQILWSMGSLRGQLLSFFASKALQSRVRSLKTTDPYFPKPLQNVHFNGRVYQLNEWVLDIPSVLKTLSEPYQAQILKIDETQGYSLRLKSHQTHPSSIDTVQIQHQGRQLTLKPKFVLFTTGSRNQDLLSLFPQTTPTQERPLHMVWTLFPENSNHALYGHCLSTSLLPRMTITTHQNQQGQTVWYLGGQVAETGVTRTTEAQILFAKQECQTIFPWIDFSKNQWGTLRINRAEPQQPHHQKPDSAVICRTNNLILGWPTKLALAPVLSDHFIECLKPDRHFLENGANSHKHALLKEQLASLAWPTAQLARLPWIAT